MTTATASKWIRVTKHNPCPVFKKARPVLNLTGGKTAICARISKFEREGSLLIYVNQAEPPDELRLFKDA